MNMNRSIFPYERMGGPFSGGDVTTEVASLSDIKEPSTNVIYKVPTINGFNKNYIFGQEFDIFTTENFTEEFSNQVIQILTSKGITQDDAGNIMLLLMYGIATANFVTTGAITINMYDNGKYIFKTNIFSQMIGQEEPIEKE